jgi:hypothetical protein
MRGGAPDRVISTVDPEARHGHKTAARGFDGYQGHIAVDAESEKHHGDGGDGGRRARMRGCERVRQDFSLLAASVNLARLAALGIRVTHTARAAGCDPRGGLCHAEPSRRLRVRKCRARPHPALGRAPCGVTTAATGAGSATPRTERPRRSRFPAPT